MPDLDTKTRILDEAQALVQRLGANGMSYKHVSEAVGIRKASIHHHFPTKTALLSELLERYTSTFLEAVDDLISRDLSDAEKLKRYLRLFEKPYQDGPDRTCLCAMLATEIESLEEEPTELLRGFFAENHKRLSALLGSGRRSGEFVFAGTPSALAHTVFALLEGALLMTRAEGTGIKRFREVTRQLQRLVGL